MLLLTRQAEPLTVAVLTTEHHVLTHGGNDDICLLGHLQSLGLVSLLTRVHLTVQKLILPSTSVAQFSVFGLDTFRPVATTSVHHVDSLGLTGGHTFKKLHNMWIVTIGHIHHHLPEI